MLKKFGARAAVVGAAAALAVSGLAGTAQARAGAPYIGDGYANNTNAVWCVQHIINNWKASWGPGAPQIAQDGVWGPQTRQAVIDFQNAFTSNQADGVVGPRTGYALLTNDPKDGYAGHGYCYTYIPSTSGY
ncbi:hypothetical protein A8W25_26340 [Streptomyces sp. ERV7]|nr:hypothetical protein A8W25_26340 [Streptomyces sp. ERV7]